MNLNQLALAANLAGCHQSVEEIAKELASTPRAVREGLKRANIPLDPKPYGYRAVTVVLSPQHIESLRLMADEQGLAGANRHSNILQQIGRRLAHPALLQAALDLTKSAVVLRRETMEALKADAAKRSMSVQDLAAKIVKMVAKDRIVAAVVDG